MWDQRGFRTAARVGFGVVLVQLAWNGLGSREGTAALAFNDLIPLVPIAFGVVAAMRARARASGRARRGWLSLCLAITAWGIGEAIWSYYELVAHREVPFPSPADAGFLGMLPLAGAAIISFAGFHRSVALTTLLDGLISASTMLFIGWATLLGAVLRSSSGSSLEIAISLAYPLGDIALLTGLLLTAGRTRTIRRGPMAYVGTGLACLAIADAGFTYLVLNGTYTSGGPIDAAWTAGFVLISLGAMRAAIDAPLGAEEAIAGPARVPAPLYVTLFGAVVTGAYVQIRDGALSPTLFWLAAVTVSLVILRQFITLRENIGLTHSLERRVDERTAELQQALAQVSVAQALQDRFVASISHELRTPLTSIIGATQTLLRPDFDFATYGPPMAELAVRGARRMERAVEDLLVASALTDHIECASSPFDVAAAVRGALDPALIESGRVYVIAPPSIVAMGDDERFRIALEHVVDNARKFTPRGGRIWVDVFPRADTVEIVIRDEGPGIPDQLRERVFDRFYQIDSSTTRAHEGAGLGLFIARRLLEGMGGWIHVDRTRERGTSVRLSLHAMTGAVIERRDDQPETGDHRLQRFMP